MNALVKQLIAHNPVCPPTKNKTHFHLLNAGHALLLSSVSEAAVSKLPVSHALGSVAETSSAAASVQTVRPDVAPHLARGSATAPAARRKHRGGARRVLRGRRTFAAASGSTLPAKVRSRTPRARFAAPKPRFAALRDVSGVEMSEFAAPGQSNQSIFAIKGCLWV